VPRLSELDLSGAAFRTQEEVQVSIEKACGSSFHLLGESEEGRPMYGAILGNGPKTVSLLAGAHSDEPVGPETLRSLILQGAGPWLDGFRFVIVPHVNPDGEARNREWMERWPDPVAYLRHVFREPPGRDVEFGYPAMRVENRLVSEFLRAHAPYALHMSLHGMAVAEGAMLLVERHWAGSTQTLRDGFRRAASEAGLAMHDHNRKGEKGFFYIEAGFWTTPEGAAMRHHFRAKGDPETAALFHDSSMEFVRGLGGDPLCLVTELPLYVVPNPDPRPGVPAAYLAFKERLPELALRARRGEPLYQDVALLRPVELATAMRLQLEALELGLEHVG
jgi:hypothetical protein